MRLPDQEHTSRPWRIHELTRDFRVEDVWALPAAGGRDDFPRLVAQLAAADPARGSSRATRALWMIRRRIGGMLGWDGLFRRERSGLLFATFVQQRNTLARAIWGRAEPAHRRVVSSLLTQAARREAAS